MRFTDLDMHQKTNVIFVHGADCGDMYEMIVEGTMWDEQGFTITNNKRGRKEFVLNGTDPNQMQRLFEHHVKLGSDKKTIEELLSKHHRWITWVDENDEVHIIPEEYGGWSAEFNRSKTYSSKSRPFGRISDWF